MVKYKSAVVPGDCVGPEVTAEGVKILKATAEKYGFEVSLAEYMVGGVAIDVFGDPLPEKPIDGCHYAPLPGKGKEEVNCEAGCDVLRQETGKRDGEI